MDWLKLFILLVAVTSVHITADAPKKKIRIHLPQKVKHIHHHKKIYITNHPASSQYAPAFMPNAEGAVVMPTNVAMPSVASLLPLNSVELYDESPTRMPGISSAASKLVPLYRARGYYGPTPTNWDERDYDLSSSAELGSYVPAASMAPSTSSNYPSNKVKILKLNEPPRKNIPRKGKTKRVTIRNKPQPQGEDEHPVTTFHEQFYSDIDGSGTIRKIKRPQRVEKIIDGDTEHIHTYSEEHIHKIIFDDVSKLSHVVGIDSVGSMSEPTASHPFVPFKNPQALIALSPGFTAVGSMGTPSHLEYAAYNPRDVTHDHIFHDHGEIPVNVDFTKEHLPIPPTTTYSSQGLRIGGSNGVKNKYPVKHLKYQHKPSHVTDFSYYENIYAPYNKFRSIRKPTIPTPFEASNEANVEDYRPVVPSLKLKNKGNVISRNVVPALYFGQEKPDADYRLEQGSALTPYSLSSTVIHEYKPKHFPGRTGETGPYKFGKQFYGYPNNDFDIDSHASSSNLYATENYPQNFPVKKEKKKSMSTQNISFGGLDHQSTVDHLHDSGISATYASEGVPTAFDNSFDQSKAMETAPSTVFTIRESSPVHPYYKAMAVKALRNDDQLSLAEASNDNYQYAVSPPTTPNEPSEMTTSPPTEYYELQNSESETITTDATNYETRPRSISNEQSPEKHREHKDQRSRYKVIAFQEKRPTRATHTSGSNHYNTDSLSVISATGNLKYGDKI